MKVVDMFGRPQGSMDFGSANTPLPYKVETGTDGAKYICFFETGDTPRAIHRLTATELTVAFGKWSEKETLAYGEPNANILVEAK